MFSIIQNIISELTANLEGFTGGYVGLYETSLIDNAKTNLFYLKDRNKETARIETTGRKEPVRVIYELSVVVQYAKNINTDILFKKVLFSLNSACQNRAGSVSVSYDSPSIAESETGLKLKSDLNLMKVDFTYTHFMKITDCKECLTDITC